MRLLSGIRVVEMGLWAAGPAAGGILADWGAEVIKIERPSGDPMRNLFRALSGSKQAKCPPFDVLNRGKRSVVLDVNQPSGRDILERIIATADVFVTNMRPRFLERIDLGPDRVLADNPRLVYAALTGYGRDGPDTDAPGFDIAAFSARSGLSDRASPPGEPPPTLPGGVGDNVTAITTVAAIMAALYHRERVGQGQFVATSLLRAGVYCISMDLATRIGLGRVAPPPSRAAPPNPLMNCYQAGDGKWFWLVGAEAERHWPGLVRVLGDPAVSSDPRFESPRDRRRHAEALVSLLDAAFARLPRQTWAERFTQHDVWWAPVNSLDDLLADPQAQAAGAFVDVPGATIEEDRAERGVATPVDFGEHATSPVGPPPSLGADTDDVLRGLGIEDAALNRLRADGVI